jgi:HB1, ASXL, restriction endonuclease HTH domain
MSQNLGWKDAIYQSLSKGDGPMHYSRIAERIAECGLRSDLGATPAITVASVITQSLQKEGPRSPFVRAGRGFYALRTKNQSPPQVTSSPPEEAAESTGLVNAFGMFWERQRCRGKKSLPFGVDNNWVRSQ